VGCLGDGNVFERSTAYRAIDIVKAHGGDLNELARGLTMGKTQRRDASNAGNQRYVEPGAKVVDICRRVQVAFRRGFPHLFTRYPR
jgi:hypothetical protein